METLGAALKQPRIAIFPSDLLDLGFRVRHFADEDVAGGVDAAFGVGVEHGNSCNGLFGREAQLRKAAPGLDGSVLDIRCRLKPALLLQKQQIGAGADLAAVVGQQKAGPGDFVILEQEHAGLLRLARVECFQREVVHGFLDRQFAEIGGARSGGVCRQRLPVVLEGAGCAHRYLAGGGPLRQFLAGRRLVARHFVQHHIDQHNRPAGLEQQVERIRIGQRDERPGVGKKSDVRGHRERLSLPAISVARPCRP